MFIDSHAHSDGSDFDTDREQIMQRAAAAGVTHILNVGTGNPHDGVFERALALSEQHANVYTALGTHPHDAKHYDDAAEQKTKTLLKAPRVVAWGEIGLDFHYDNSPRDVQKDVFARQLRGALDIDLPVIIHTREAEDETIEILQTEFGESTRRGVFHCFSGSMSLAQRALELGFLISFSGIVTFKKSQDLREVAKQVPLDRLLVETDCPFLTPVPYRGWRNEPAFVVEVAKCLAEVHGVELETIAERTTENFEKLFGVNF
jgi:TatD DNase family protein